MQPIDLLKDALLDANLHQRIPGVFVFALRVFFFETLMAYLSIL